MSLGPERIFACDFRVNKNNGDTITDPVSNSVGTYTYGITSNLTNGLDCDGVGMVEFPFNQYFDMHDVDTNNHYYVEVYFFADSISNEDTYVAFGRESSAGYFWSGDSYLHGQINVRFGNDSKCQIFAMGPNNSSHLSTRNSTTISTNQWNHAVIYGTSSGLRVHLNGGTASGPTDYSTGNSSVAAATYDALYIGAHNHSTTGNNYGIHGNIRYVRLYKGNEMTQDMVTELYNNRETIDYVPTFSVEIDTTPPTAAITYSYAGPYRNGGSNVTITATFDEDMADDPVPKIIITGSGIANIAATEMTKASESVYTYDYTIPLGDGTGTVTLSTGTDTAGNVITSAPTSGNTFIVDNSAPTAAITYSYAGPYRNGGSNVTITATFNEDMADDPVPQIIITGSGIANIAATEMTKASESVYTYDYTIPLGEGTGTVTLSTGTDTAGNVITTVPTSGDTFTVTNKPIITNLSMDYFNTELTVTFIEDVFTNADGTGDLTINDFSISINGGVATLTSVDSISKTTNSEYVFNITIDGLSLGAETLTIVPASETSIYSANGIAMSTTQEISTINLNNMNNPYINTLTVSSNNSIKTNYAGENDIVTLTIVADESLTSVNVSFKSGGVAVTNSPTVSGSGTQWSAQYTVSSYDTNGIISFVMTIQDSASNSTISLDSPTTTDSSSVTKVALISVSTEQATTANQQLGSQLQGESGSDYFGKSVSLNGDGTIMAVGGYGDDAGASNAGHVRVYQYINSDWSQLGSDIDGTSQDDYSGMTVSLSSDGTTVAIGAMGADIAGSNSGQVRVYQFSSGSWNKIGNDINGAAENDKSGWNVSLNYNGTILANVSRNAHSYNGETRVYQYDSVNNTWNQLGDDLDPTSAGTGTSCSLNYDGTIVAMGKELGVVNGTQKGYVQVYQYDNGNNTWDQLGTNIDGVGNPDYFGCSVSISNDGTIVACGARENDDNGDKSGHVGVFEFSNGSWEQLGGYIVGDSASATSGFSVSISGDGTIVAIGAPASSDYLGKVRVYQFSNGSWNQIGNDYNGTSSNGQFGNSVSLNNTGSIVAIGSPIASSSRGLVNIYETGNPTITTTYTNAIPPDVTSLTIASNNSSSQGAKVGDEITLSFEFDLSINTPMVSFQSNGVNIADTSIDIVGTNDTIWTAKYTVDATDQEGAVTFTIDASAIDTFGEKTHTESDITNESSVTIDNTAPIISSTSINSDNSELTVTFSENVFTNTDGTGDLTASDFSFTISGGTVTLTSINSVTKTSNSVYVLNLSLTEATGAETITVTLASSTSIYNIAAIAMSTTLTNNTTILNKTLLIYSSVSISSNNTLNSSFASYYTNDIVTLTIVSEENIGAATISFKSGGVSVNNSVSVTSSGNTHTAQYVVSGSDTTGIITFTVDLLGLQIVGTTDRSRVEVVGFGNIEYSTTTPLDNPSTAGQPFGETLLSQAYSTIGNQNYGYSISFNADGTIMAIGAASTRSPNSTNSSYGNVGRAYIYEYNSGTNQWDSRGTLVGNYSIQYGYPYFGASVALNGDGSILAVGSPGKDTGPSYSDGYDRGEVQVYEYNSGSNSYSQKGATISGTVDHMGLGRSVTLNYDGTILGIGTYTYNSYNGIVAMYKYNSGTNSWDTHGSSNLLEGPNVENQTNFKRYAQSVSLNDDGTRIAVAGRYNANVWEYSETDISWNLLGNNLNLVTDSSVVNSISMNGDGSIFATFNIKNGSNVVQVFEYNTTESSWNQLGDDITDGTSVWLQVALNKAGNVIIVGDPYANNNDGKCWIYQYNGFSWDLLHEASGDDEGQEAFGSSVVINEEGTQFAAGSPDFQYTDGGSILYDGAVKCLGSGLQNEINISEIEGPFIFISNVSISSNNATSSSIATSDGNNEITLTITAIYNITQPTVTFQTGGVDISGNVTVSGSGKEYTASFIADRVDNLGDVTFSITNYENNSIAGGEIINTTDGSKVKLVGKRFAETTRASVANTQLGGDFIGIDNEDEKLGKGVAINGDGSIIAMSSPGNDEVNSSQGKVDVFEYDYVNTSWNIMGSSIRPIHFGIPDTWSFGNYRSSISLDENGTTLAMFAESTSDTTVYIVIVKYDGTVWTQLGSTITLSKTVGENMNLKLNSFGHHLIVGLESNNSAYVYRYNGYYWFQLGNTITSENTYSELQFGYSVAINSTGNRILVGSNPTGSYTSNYSNIIYEYRASQWVKAHEFSLKNQGSDNGWGCSVDMSSDGNTISIGGAYSPDSWPNYSTDQSTGDPVYSTGVIILQYDGSSWNQLGNKITSTNDSSWGFGTTHSLSKDGTVILVGEPDAEDESSNSNVGRSYVYQYDGSSTWNQVGTTYIGKGHVQSNNVQLAKYLGLSADGTTMMVGASGYDITGSTSDDHGLVQVFETGCGNKTIFDKIDNIIPEFNTLTLSSNATYSQYAGTGNTITLSMVTDVSVNSPTVSFTTGGNDISGNVTITGSETTWTASFVVDAADSLGVVDFAAQVSSLDNIEGLLTNTTTDNTGITVVSSSAIPPTITSLTIASNNTENTKYAGENDVVTLNIVADVSMNEPTVSFTSGGVEVTGGVTYTGSDTSWTAQYTVNSADTLGSVAFTVDTQSVALLGNTSGVQAKSTTDISEVTIVDKVSISVTSIVSTTHALQLGTDIDGENAGDTSGRSVALNNDGTIVAIGSNQNDANGNNAGHVRVYQYSNSAWAKLGDNINGEASPDNSGWSVSLSSDGTIVAIGHPYNTGNGSDAGLVRVYQYSNSAWTKLGDDIEGEAGDQFGYAVSLNSDGTIVAIGAWKHNGGNTNSGTVRVYQYSNSAWTKLGDDIDGVDTNEYSGKALSLSSDGTIVAIGANGHDSSRGTVRIYQYSNSAWTKLGDDIDGEAQGDLFGVSVSLSSDGTIVAIGANKNWGAPGDQSGHTRVYQYDASKTSAVADQNSSTFGPAGWNRLGNDIDGELASEFSGCSVSLSSDGTIVAIGAKNGNSQLGTARTYQYSNLAWTKLGDNIDGAATGDYFGYVVSLSGNGSTVAIGTPFHDGSKGHVRIFETGQPNTVTTTSDVAAIPPTITSLTIASNNTENTKLAIANDVVTLNIVADISLNQPTVTFTSGNAAITNASAITYTGSDNSWTAQYTVDAADTVGEIGFTVDYSSALTSTSGSQKTSSTDGNVVNVVTSVAPAVSTLTISSNNSSLKTTVAAVGDVVTLALVTDININQPTVSFTSGGVAVTGAITYTGSDNSWTAQYTVNSGDTAGEIGFTVDYSSASTSTSGPQATSATDGKSVNVILPTGNLNQIPPEVTNLSVSTTHSNSSLAVTNDMITINLETDVSLSQIPSFQLKSGGIDLSGNVEITGSDFNWVANYIVEEEATNGAFTFVIDVSGTEYADNQFTEANITSGSNVSIVTSPIPRISGVSVSNNNNARITFSEDVYTTSAGAGDLQVTDFELTILTGYATLSSSTPLAITKNSGTEYDLSFSAVVGDGHSDILVGVANDSSIFNLNGLPLDAGYASNNIAVLGDNFISNLSLSSNSIYRSDYAQPGDIVNLDIKALKPILQPTVVFKSDNASVYNSVVYTGSDVSWNASYTVHTNDTYGNVTFTINYTDLESNSGIESSSTTDNTSVTIVPDILQVPPTLVGLTHTYTQSANNSSQGKNYVSTGDSYVIYAEFKETLGSLPVIDISIGGNSIAQSGYIFDTLTQYTNPVAEQYNENNDKQYRWNFDIEQYMGDGDITYTIDVSYSYITVTHTSDEITDSSVFTSVRNGPIYESVVDVGLNGLRVTFNKDVFTESDGTGDLVINTFEFAQYGNSGTLYLNSLYPTSVTKVTNSVYDLSYDMVGELENNTSAFLVAVFKRTSALIYDASGLLFTTQYKGSAFLYDSTVVSLTSVSIASDNSSKTMFASYYTNDTVTLSFTSSESLYGTPVVSFTAGGADISGNVTVSGSGTTWTASYLVNQVDTLGLIGFTIDFTDGYNSQQVTATTDNSKVTTVGTFTGVIESTVTTTTTSNIQIGGDIDDFGIGSSCVLNSDGTIVAAGAASDNGNGNNSGSIKVYKYDGSSWNQLGGDIDGQYNATTPTGYFIAMSDDGSVVASGEPSYTSNANPGRVRVWLYSTPGVTGGTWTQIGSDLTANYSNSDSGDLYGMSVALSSDGTILAAGALYANSYGGIVNVWKYSTPGLTGGTWQQLGTTFTGSNYQNLGSSCALSDDGSILATGLAGSDGDGSGQGTVKVWKYSNSDMTTGGSWQQMGDNINGNNNSDRIGGSVSLSSDGSVLATGSKDYYIVSVFVYSTPGVTGGDWTQIGNDIRVGGITAGTIVSLSSIGNTLAVSGNEYLAWKQSNQGIDSDDTFAKVYTYSNSDMTTGGSWSTIGNDYLANKYLQNGSKVSLNGDGTRIAVSHDGQDNVKVFETGVSIETTTSSLQTVPAIPPVISSLGILSNNTLSTSHATDGNTITVSMTYDENLTQSPTVTFQSGGLDVALSTTISGSDATYTASYEVDPNDTQGDVTFVIDASGTLADTNDTQLEITDGSSMEMLDSGPFFVSVTNEINKNISIEFNTDVYNTNTASGDLETSDFVLAVESGDVTLTSTTPSAISKVSNKIYDLSFSLTETVTTNVPIVSINPVDSTSIYNSVGFAMIAPQTTDNSFNLIDRLPPSLTSVSISSNNTFKTKYASYFAPDTVTLTLTASENINQPVVTFTVDDVPVTDTINYSGSGASWTVSFVVTSSTPLGNLSFSIDYTDTTDGNAGTTVTSTTDATNMLIVGAVVTGTSTVQSDNFEQYGQTLFGPASSGDRYFFSSDINNDGTIMVTSNYYTLDPVYGDNFFNVVVYEFDGASWTQKGSTLYQSSTSLASVGSGGNNQFGYSVSINSTGDIIAIGEDAYESQTNANNSSNSWGAVHIFQYDGSDWIQMGNSIVSSTEKSFLGSYVKLSSDGLTLIANSTRYPDLDYTGRVEIYTYNSSNTTWELKGNAIEGETTGERFGYHMDQTSDCLTFAASSYFYKNAESVIIGKVEVYTYNAVDNSFNQVGQTIYGTDGNSRIYFPAISNDGTVLVTGRSSDDTPETNAGTVIVYKYDGTSWNQMGQTLYGTNENDLFGVSIACNADGSQILIGARTDENYTDTGSVSLYKYDGTSWNLVSILHGTRQNQYAHYITTNNSFEYLVLNTSTYKPDGTNMDGILETFKLSEKTVNQGYVLYPPDATAVTVDSNGAHGTSVGVGETVSINIDFNEIVYDLSNISILIDDVSINNPFTITPDPPATSFTISFVISESDPSGNITFSMDASGALGVNTITHNLITDGSSMETDFTLPVFAGSVSTSTQLNNFDPTYLQGFLDISGAGIRMQNDSKLFIGGDVSLAGNMFIDSTNSVKINTTENNAGYSLDVSGNTDLSGNVTIAGDIDVSGNVVGMVNYNTINKDIPPISNSAIDYSDNTDETALPVGIKVMTSDNSFNSTTATIHNDLSANGNFGSTFIFDNSLSVAGSVLVSDLSQNSYGAYTIYSKKDSTDSFMVGKSASNVFTIVNQSNVGVFMNSDSNVLTSTSDKNLKTNISNLENNSDNIMKLRPVEFNWNYEADNKKKHVGFIAQEVEEIFPELVEENVYPNGEVYKGVNTNKLIPYMIDEIKLLEEKLEKLEKIK